MWFKNLQVYRFTKPFQLSPEELNEKLSKHQFHPCGAQDLSSSGWIPPLGRHGTEMVHATDQYIMICNKRQDKVLPASVVNETLEEKALEIEDAESRNVGRKERQSLKDDIIFSLLPRAFARSSLQFAYIAKDDGLLIVNSTSAKRAEELTSELRESLGTLSLIPLMAKNIPIDVMTRWLKDGQATDNFEVGEECELRDNADISSLIRFKNHDLKTTEIHNHLKAGMHVSKLAISWQERIECVFDENLAIKRLKFTDVVQEKADEVEAEDVAEKFDVDFSIMTLELSAFIKAVLSAFGGEDTHKFKQKNKV